jgi:hypothetical protein
MKAKSKKISKNKTGLTPTIQRIEDAEDRYDSDEEAKLSETPVGLLGVDPDEPSNFSQMKCAIDDPATNFSLGY